MVYSKYATEINKRKKRSKAFSARVLGVTFLVITTSLLIFFKITIWLQTHKAFLLKEVKIEGTRFIAEEELRSSIQVDSTKTIFSTDLKAISTQVRKHPLVKNVKVSRRLPSSIIVEIFEKEPLALLYESSLLAVDETGTILPDIKLEMLHDFPIITKLELPEKYIEPTPEISLILNFLKFTKTHYFTIYSEISEISYSQKTGIYFYLMEGTIPVYVGDTDFNHKSTKLLNILNYFNRENNLSNIEYFDLRFEGQIVVKELKRS